MPVPATNGYGWAVTPRASASYLLVRPSGKGFLDGTRLKFNYALGIKEPRLVESFSPYESYLGNPELRPERGLSLEGGMEQYFHRVLSKLEINYYDNRYKDLVDYIMTGFDPNTWAVYGTYINSEKTRARGAEVALSTQSLRNLRLSASYNYLQSYFTESLTRPGDPIVSGKLSLLRRPKHSGNLTLTYSIRKLTLYLSDTYIGQRNDVNPVFVWGMPGTLVNGSFNKLDLGLTCRVHPRISLLARIDNLLNRKYEEILGYPAYHLNFSSGVQVRLGGRP
jgi:vitamin B12 transporter